MKKRINLLKALSEGYTISWKKSYKVENKQDLGDLELIYKLFGWKKDGK